MTARIPSPMPGPVATRRHVLASAAALLALGGTGARAAEPNFFRIATGAPAGTYFPLGGLIANAISNPPGSPPCGKGGSCGVPGLIAVAQATSGSVENIGLLRAGSVEMAFSQSDTAFWAYIGGGPFSGEPPLTTLRSVGALYTEAVHLVVRADSPIHSPADLAGRVVSIGEHNSGTPADVRLILDAYGIAPGALTSLNLRFAVAAERLAKGEIDAFFYIGGAPLPAIAELASSTPIRLIPLDDPATARLREDQRFLQPAVIPGGTYKDVPDTATLGVAAELVTAAHVPVPLIHDVTKALWNEATLKLLADGHPRGRTLSPIFAANTPAIPLHEGAIMYYRETGILATESKDAGSP